MSQSTFGNKHTLLQCEMSSWTNEKIISTRWTAALHNVGSIVKVRGVFSSVILILSSLASVCLMDK